MILLWGLLEDTTLRPVYEWLMRCHADVLFVNHAAIDRTVAQFATEPTLAHRLRYEGRTWELDREVTAAYLRPYDFRDYGIAPGVAQPEHVMATRGTLQHLLNGWAEHSEAIIINRPSAEATNHSKPGQGLVIAAHGLRTPDSLISNDPDEIRAFQARHGRVVYKSMSSVRSIVQELSTDQLEARALGPVLFQARIVGTNIRTHVVGERVFACEIETEGLDYRYAPSRLLATTLPEEIARRAVDLTRALGLRVSGIDLIVTPSGEWYCLEVNPNPGFSYYELDRKAVIAEAVGELLMGSD